MLSFRLFSIFLGALCALLSIHFSASLYVTWQALCVFLVFIIIVFLLYVYFGHVYLKNHPKFLVKTKVINKSKNKFIYLLYTRFYISYIRLKYILGLGAHKNNIQINILLFMLSYVLFFMYANFLSQQRLQYRLQSEYYNKTLSIPFKITSLPTETDTYWKFKAKVISPNILENNLLIKNIQVYIYKPKFTKNNNDENTLLDKTLNTNRSADTYVPKFKVGDVWNIPLKYKPPYANQNPYLFDYEFYLFYQNIHAIASTTLKHKTSLSTNYIGHVGWYDNTFIEQVRQYIRIKMHTIIAPLKYKGILLALSIGDQSYLTKKEWQLFNQSGIGHLISISGLHISMLALIFASIPLVFIRLYPKILYYINKRYVCSITGLIASGLYVLISGSEIPAQRTWLMLLLIFLFYKHLSIGANLCVAALCIMLWDPWAVGSNSFWLSFSAVGLLIFMGSFLYQRDHWRNSIWYLSITSQIGISLAMIPISINIFGQFSIVSPLANAIAIPLVSYIIAPLTLLASLLSTCEFISKDLLIFLFNMAHTLLTWVINWCTYAINLPLAFGYAAMPNIWVFLVSILGILCLLMPYVWRWFGLIFFIPLFLHKNNEVKHPHAFHITFLDVGQGSSILISTQNHKVLFDTAGAYQDNIVADKIVIPTLQRIGVKKLDDLILSHADQDHTGGFASVLNLSLPIEKLWVGMSLEHPLLQKNLNIYNINNNLHKMHIKTCAPSTWIYDGVYFNMLHPLFGHDFSDDTYSNIHSCVLKITAGNHSVMITGDLLKEQEKEMIENYGNILESDIMLAPHHGSKTSSSQDFLTAVKPKHAIIQNGFLNHYNHPHPSVMQRYNDENINIWRTDELGAISVYVDTKKYKIDAQKIVHKRYWML